MKLHGCLCAVCGVWTPATAAKRSSRYARHLAAAENSRLARAAKPEPECVQAFRNPSFIFWCTEGITPFRLPFSFQSRRLPLFCLVPSAINTMTIQECVNTLTEKSKAGNEMVANLVQSLGSALVYPDAGNFETNRKLWDNYAAEWEPNARCLLSERFSKLLCRLGPCGMHIGVLLPTQIPLMNTLSCV